MWSGGFLRRTTIPLEMAPDGPGSPLSVTRKIAFIVLICSDVNRWRCGRTGYWSLWINTFAALSDSAFTPASSMDRHCVGCSIERFDGKRFRNISFENVSLSRSVEQLLRVRPVSTGGEGDSEAEFCGSVRSNRRLL